MRKIILVLILAIITNVSFSQSFMHGAGITIFGSTTGEGSSSDIGFGEGFTYTPRFNFFETDKLSVSVSIPLSVGITASTTKYDQYGDQTSAIGFLLNVPVIVGLNMGRGSSKVNRQKFGYFFGAGFGYHHGDVITSEVIDYNNGTFSNSYTSNTFGPAANAGVRMGVGKKYKNIEVRLSYMKGMNEKKPNIFAVACLFNF